MLKNKTEAIKELEISLNLKQTARTLYRIGRYICECNNKKSIEYLYQSVLLNPSCSCALLYFKVSAHINKIKLKTNTNKYLAKIFNNTPSLLEYHTKISTGFRDREFTIDNGEVLSVQVVLNDFLVSLKADKSLFLKPICEKAQTEEIRAVPLTSKKQIMLAKSRYSSYYEDEYPGSYDSNGYDDETIDNVFDGDPMNTWNVK